MLNLPVLILTKAPSSNSVPKYKRGLRPAYISGSESTSPEFLNSHSLVKKFYPLLIQERVCHVNREKTLRRSQRLFPNPVPACCNSYKSAPHLIQFQSIRVDYVHPNPVPACCNSYKSAPHLIQFQIIRVDYVHPNAVPACCNSYKSAPRLIQFQYVRAHYVCLLLGKLFSYQAVNLCQNVRIFG